MSFTPEQLQLITWLIPVPPLLSFALIVLFTNRSKLLSHLGLGEPHRLRRLQRCGDSPQLLQPGNPINPNPIRRRCAVEDNRSQLLQDLIQPHHHGIRRWRLATLDILEC